MNWLLLGLAWGAITVVSAVVFAYLCAIAVVMEDDHEAIRP